MINEWEHDTNIGEMIPYERAEMVLKENNIDCDRMNEIAQRVFVYWKKQREKLKHPLLRSYWKSTLTKDEALNIIFSSASANKMSLRKSRNTAADQYKKMRKLKKGGEIVLEILEAIKYRESLKRHLISC